MGGRVNIVQYVGGTNGMEWGGWDKKESTGKRVGTKERDKV